MTASDLIGSPESCDEIGLSVISRTAMITSDHSTDDRDLSAPPPASDEIFLISRRFTEDLTVLIGQEFTQERREGGQVTLQKATLWKQPEVTKNYDIIYQEQVTAEKAGQGCWQQAKGGLRVTEATFPFHHNSCNPPDHPSTLAVL